MVYLVTVSWFMAVWFEQHNIENVRTAYLNLWYYLIAALPLRLSLLISFCVLLFTISLVPLKLLSSPRCKSLGRGNVNEKPV